MMNSHATDSRAIYTVALACIFVILTGCSSSGGAPGSFRFQSNPASSWGNGARWFEPGLGPASRNTPENPRGNTPPGTDRAGSPPGSGTIVDPAGMLAR